MTGAAITATGTNGQITKEIATTATGISASETSGPGISARATNANGTDGYATGAEMIAAITMIVVAAGKVTASPARTDAIVVGTAIMIVDATRAVTGDVTAIGGAMATGVATGIAAAVTPFRRRLPQRLHRAIEAAAARHPPIRAAITC